MDNTTNELIEKLADAIAPHFTDSYRKRAVLKSLTNLVEHLQDKQPPIAIATQQDTSDLNKEPQ